MSYCLLSAEKRKWVQYGLTNAKSQACCELVNACPGPASLPPPTHRPQGAVELLPLIDCALVPR